MHWDTLRFELLERRRRRVVRTYAVLALLMILSVAFVGTCVGQTPRIPDAKRFYPDYTAAYVAATACTKTWNPPPLRDVVWMSVPRQNFTDPYAPDEEGKLPNIGEWVKPDTIYIAQPWADSWVPKHELIHYIRGEGSHPREVFGEACHAMWGYLETDTMPSKPGHTIYGPAWKYDDQ